MTGTLEGLGKFPPMCIAGLGVTRRIPYAVLPFIGALTLTAPKPRLTLVISDAPLSAARDPDHRYGAALQGRA